MIETKISTKGQLVIPSSLRKQDGILEGDVFELERLDAGCYRLVRKPGPVNQGVLDWLLNCPAKDWPLEIDSESTNTVKSPWGDPQDEVFG